MTIVSSSITSTSVEVDGRRRVDELHIDDQGVQFTFTYLADAAFNIQAQLTARAAALPAQCVASEIAANIDAVKRLGSLAVITFKYSSVAQNAAAVRVAYKTATQRDAIQIGDFLSTLTDAQLMSAFGLTLPQVTAQRAARLTPQATQAANIRAAVGA